MEPLVSVIVPVYNVENYLLTCLNSIRNQSYQNLEIILVDDGSTDGSGAICDDYVVQDPRASVIHKENGGLSNARNSALDICKGEYIVFVDSDDYVHVDYVKLLLEGLQKYKCDLVVCNFVKFAGDFASVKIQISEKIELLNGKDAMLKFLYGTLPTYAHGKMYKMSAFRDLRFPSNRLYEDVPIIWEILRNINAVCYVQTPLYYYRQRKESIVNAPYSHRKMDQVFFAGDILLSTQNECLLHEGAKVYYFFCICDQLTQIDNNFPEYRKFLCDEIKKVRASVLKNSRCRLKLRMLALVSCASFSLVRRIGLLYKSYSWKRYEKNS